MFHKLLTKVKRSSVFTKTVVGISALVGGCLMSETPTFAISLNNTSNFIGTEIEKKNSPSGTEYTITGGLEVDNTLYHYFNVFDIPGNSEVKFNNDSNIKTIVVKADAYNYLKFGGALEANKSLNILFLNLGLWGNPLTSSQFNKLNRELEQLNIKKGIDVHFSEDEYIQYKPHPLKFRPVKIFQQKKYSEESIQLMQDKFKYLDSNKFAPRSSTNLPINKLHEFYQPIPVIPEPLTILGSVTAIGIGFFIKKNQSQPIKKQEE